MNRVDRLLGYLLLLQSRKLVRAQDLAARFEVSERTVYRDMEALGELGVPISGMAGEGYRLMPGYVLPPVMFSHAEARALFLAIAMLSGLTADGPTRQAATTALEKVRAVLPPAILAQVEALQTVLGFYAVGRPPLDLDNELFVQLQGAINQRQVIYLHYHAQHSNRITAREVEPLHLGYVGRAWVLHGYCRLRQDHRNFRLDRIDHLTVKTETFAPRALNLPSMLEEGQRVLVRFDATVVRWVRETQHYTFVEELAEDDDGNVVMAFNVGALNQISGWLLGWGEGMEVLEPAELRAAIAQTAARMAQRHKDA